ncbi:MAG: hypothetical protein JRD89_18850 [Deltaproteobacteria bacterium]|nr:hypothetical protein [Deltaproteobacteria bacterium]
MNPYAKLIRSFVLVVEGYFNSLWILGKPGTGKSFQTDLTLKRLKADYVVFRGDISDAYLYEFLYLNRDKIIVFRDVAKLLRRLNCIDTFKAITETNGPRIISRKTYAEHEVPDEFEFTGKVIFEINDIMRRYHEDLMALFSRGLFVELNFSVEDMCKIMFQVAKEDWQKEVTKYLISKVSVYGISNFNLRTQSMCFKLYQAAKRDGKDWKRELDLFFDQIVPTSRKLLYRRYRPVKRIDFVKYLMKEMDWSYATAQRKIRDWIVLGEIYTNGLKQGELLSLHPFRGNSELE